MVVSEGDINNIMSGMENTAGVRLHSHRHKLKQRFLIVRKLGQGTYGKVQLAVNKETGQQVAIKTIKKAKIETEQDLVRIRREIQIMSSVQHPQIIHIYEVFENREKMVLVMEYAAGGELYDYLSERKVLAEDEARRVFRQVASAVYYCHKHKICHRDLKLENILLDEEGNAKIADFGLSNVFDEKRRLDTFCGSPLYASPEIVKGVPYVGPEVDCWSLGVLLYTLVYGAMPFDGSNFRRLVKQITSADFFEPATPATASELIRSMLAVSSTDRADIGSICSHWWVNEGFPEASCLTLAEGLAMQTPVRLDLLLSLAPKQISSEHMLIQPDQEDEENSFKSDSERSGCVSVQPTTTTPPSAGASANGTSRCHSLGSLPTSQMADLEGMKKDKQEKGKDADKKQETIKRKPPSQSSITSEDETKKKRKEENEGKKSDDKVKKRDRSKERVKKRDESLERRREASAERDKSEREGKKTKKKSSKKKEEEARSDKQEKEKIISKTPSTDISSETVEKQKPKVNSQETPKESPETDAKPKISKQKLGEPQSQCRMTSDDATAAILQQTADKIEGGISPCSPLATSPPVSPLAVASPTRSSSGSESSSRRHSKVFSRASMFEELPSPSSGGATPSKRSTPRPSQLNMADLAKKFEEKKTTTQTKNKVVPAAFKVSDARKAFESRSPPSGEKPPTPPKKENETPKPKTKDDAPKSKSKESIVVSKKPEVEIETEVKTEIKQITQEVKKVTPEIAPEVVSKAPVSSDEESESEAEKLLHELAQKRERLERVKQEKILKLSREELDKPEKQKEQESSGKQEKEDVWAAEEDSSKAIVKKGPMAVVKETDNKSSTLPRGFKAKAKREIEPKMNSFEEKRDKPRLHLSSSSSLADSGSDSGRRVRSGVEIQVRGRPTPPPSQRSSYAEIRIATPTDTGSNKPEYRTEARHHVSVPTAIPTSTSVESQLQRAPRERIIPIMMEDDGETQPAASIRPRQQQQQQTTSLAPRQTQTTKMSPEPIRKCRRERIIPIAIEGEGLLTPPLNDDGQPSSFNRGRAFGSNAAAKTALQDDDEDDDDDDEEDEDAFQILTAESLFSTLLARVRSLTRKMNPNEAGASHVGPLGLSSGSSAMGLEPSEGGSGAAGFWSSLYSPPRDLTARNRATGPLSRGSSRDDEIFGSLGGPLWSRGGLEGQHLRQGSDAASPFSDSGTDPFSTLPRADFGRRPFPLERHKLLRDSFFSDFTTT